MQFFLCLITPNNKQNETFNIYGFKNTKLKDIKICSHNVNRMFDEMKTIYCNLIIYPPDIIGFCETFFHENISNDSLIINGFCIGEKG